MRRFSYIVKPSPADRNVRNQRSQHIKSKQGRQKSGKGKSSQHEHHHKMKQLEIPEFTAPGPALKYGVMGKYMFHSIHKIHNHIPLFPCHSCFLRCGYCSIRLFSFVQVFSRDTGEDVPVIVVFRNYSV